MKAKLYFLLSVLAAVLGPAQMSPTAVPVNSGEQINGLESVFSNLEKERIPTGLLLDATVEYATWVNIMEPCRTALSQALNW